MLRSLVFCWCWVETVEQFLFNLKINHKNTPTQNTPRTSNKFAFINRNKNVFFFVVSWCIICMVRVFTYFLLSTSYHLSKNKLQKKIVSSYGQFFIFFVVVLYGNDMLDKRDFLLEHTWTCNFFIDNFFFVIELNNFLPVWYFSLLKWIFGIKSLSYKIHLMNALNWMEWISIENRPKKTSSFC